MAIRTLPRKLSGVAFRLHQYAFFLLSDSERDRVEQRQAEKIPAEQGTVLRKIPFVLPRFSTNSLNMQPTRSKTGDVVSCFIVLPGNARVPIAHPWRRRYCRAWRDSDRLEAAWRPSRRSVRETARERFCEVALFLRIWPRV